MPSEIAGKRQLLYAAAGTRRFKGQADRFPSRFHAVGDAADQKRLFHASNPPPARFCLLS